MSERLELTEVEKATAREVVTLNVQAQQAVEQAVRESQRRSNHVEAVVNTIVRLRGLDPAKWQLAYDLSKDLWELREIPEVPKPPAKVEAPSTEEPASVEVPTAPNGAVPGEAHKQIDNPTQTAI